MKSYTEIYTVIAAEDVFGESPAFQDMASLQMKAQADLKKLGDVNGKRILEVGPGWGNLALLLEQSNAVVSIADLVPHYIDKLAPHIRGESFLHDIQTPLWSEQFDVVVMCDVLEHLFRPSDALLAARQALRPGGLLYVRVPSHESLITYSMTLGMPYEIVHMRTYTPALLRRELKAAGFKGVHSAGRTPGVRRLPKSWLSGEWYWKHERPRPAAPTDSDDPVLLNLWEKIAHLVVGGQKPRRFPWVFQLTKPITYMISNPAEIAFTCRRPPS